MMHLYVHNLCLRAHTHTHTLCADTQGHIMTSHLFVKYPFLCAKLLNTSGSIKKKKNGKKQSFLIKTAFKKGGGTEKELVMMSRDFNHGVACKTQTISTASCVLLSPILSATFIRVLYPITEAVGTAGHFLTLVTWSGNQRVAQFTSLLLLHICLFVCLCVCKKLLYTRLSTRPVFLVFVFVQKNTTLIFTTIK